MRPNAAKFLVGLIAISMTACGGGGGGGGPGDYNGTADVAVHASPQTIDTGDRMQISIDIDNIDPNGIVLKVRHPIGLRYVAGSSFLLAGAATTDVSPEQTVCGQTLCYVIYSIHPSAFGAENGGTLELLLQGVQETVDGGIEVDPDVIDPDGAHFDISQPEFTAADATTISVRA